MPEDLTVLEGHQLITFNCRSNEPSARITWLKDGIVLTETNRFYLRINGDLEIRHLRVEDEGFYVCSISNSKNVKYAQAELIVNGNNLCH